jgi:hypothetical protein
MIGQDILRGAIDMHVHCGPEAIPRKYHAIALAHLTRKFDMGTLVIKSHFTYTSDWALLAFRETGVKIYGGITMNQYVGGVNPYALRAGLGPQEDGEAFLKIVWMPTIHSPAHLQMQSHHGHQMDIPPEWTGGRTVNTAMRLEEIDPVFIRSPEVLPLLDEVLTIISDHNLLLATGHLDKEETIFLVQRAREKGVKKILLTHPLYETTKLTIEDLKGLVGPDTFVEHSYALHTIDHTPFETMVRYIEEVGTQYCVLTSDLGQINMPSPPEGLLDFIDHLMKGGITEEGIFRMTRDNPKYLLGI